MRPRLTVADAFNLFNRQTVTDYTIST